MQEIWKCIGGYEGLYEVSNTGKVRSIYRKIKIKNGYRILVGKELKQVVVNNYMNVTLCKNGKGKNNFVHRLVAKEFIENENCFPQVNHKDENKHNNNVSNLEWCTEKYNSNYGNRNYKISTNVKSCRKIVMISEDGDRKYFDSITKAGKEFANKNGNSSISDCLSGRNKMAYGFKWEYV